MFNVTSHTFAEVKKASTSVHAGKIGKCGTWNWKNSARYVKITFADGTRGCISEHMLIAKTKADYEQAVVEAAKEKAPSSNYMVMLADRTVVGPYSEAEAETVASELMMQNTDNNCIILRAVKRCAKPRTVVDFEQM